MKTGAGVTLGEASKVWAYIAVNSFGGPAGQIAVMHRELVDRRQWISESRFLHALNFCMILPGPEAQQLAIYLGWLKHGVRGGTIAGALFVIPGAIAMLALAMVYAVFGTVMWIAGLLFGLQAAVVAIVAEAVIRIGKRTLKTRLLQSIAALSFIAMFVFNVPFPLIVVISGLAGWILGRKREAWFPAAIADDGEHDPAPSRSETRKALRAAAICAVLWLAPVAALLFVLGTDSVYTQEALVFSTSAVVTFGGAYAVLGFITQQAVERYGWIGTQDMIAGLGLAETTPGPLILVVQFVGFLAAYNSPGDLPPLLAGTFGAIVALWVTFVPCFLFIFAGAPYIERLRGNHAIRHSLSAVGAAVAGVVLNLAVWFAIHTAFRESHVVSYGPVQMLVPDVSTIQVISVAISIVAAIGVFGLRLGTLKVLALASVLGAAVSLLGLT